jgi:cell division septum initiation protein DivIVA
LPCRAPPAFLAFVSDRLNELQRQRALAQEQLAFLDREIAAEKAKSGMPHTATYSATPAPAASPTPAAMAAAAQRATTRLESALPADAEKILAEYAAKPASIQSDVKKGCFLYFFLAMATLIAAVVALYFHSRGK